MTRKSGRFVACLAAVICTSIIASQVLATPIGNPTKIQVDEDQAFSIEYEGDFVFNRDLDDDATELESNSNGVRLGYAVEDLAQIFVTLGVISGETESTVSGVTVGLETDTGFIWGLGGTIPLYKFDNGLSIGATGQYRSSELDLDKATVSGVGSAILDGSLDYQDWVVALGAAYPMKYGSPYFGVKYSDVRLSNVSISGTTFDADTNSADVVGIFVGFDLAASDTVNFNIEGRFIDETALTAQVRLKF